MHQSLTRVLKNRVSCIRVLAGYVFVYVQYFRVSKYMIHDTRRVLKVKLCYAPAAYGDRFYLQ